jgi:hypothetical protein
MLEPRMRSGGAAKQFARATLLLVCALAATQANAALPLWLHLDNTLQYKPTVDGKITFYPALQSTPGEYFRGRKFVLGNWSGIPGAQDAELYLHAMDNGSGDRRLYVALRLPIRWPSVPFPEPDRGILTIYFDADRKDASLCPAMIDRKLQVIFHAVQAATAADLVPGQTYDYELSEDAGAGGNPTCTSTTTPSDATRAHTDEGLGIKIRRDPTSWRYVVEFWIDLPTKIIQDRLFGIGIRYDDADYATAGVARAIHNFPNDPLEAVYDPVSHPNAFPTWGETNTWQTIDLGEPYAIPFGVGMWNVGQMFWATGDGGGGEPNNIAESIWQRDIVCLTEVMEGSDRTEIVELANKLRAGAKPPLPPFNVVMSPKGQEPNNMILSSWVDVTPSQPTTFSWDPAEPFSSFKHGDNIMRFMDHGATGADDTLDVGYNSGAKGIVWARLAPPLDIVDWSCDYPPCITKYHDAGAFVDVFCTHNQAPCVDFPGYTCSSDRSRVETRDKQFDAMNTWINARRARVTGGSDGLNRPAILLGDMNTVGPKNLPNNSGDHPDMALWLSATGIGDIFEYPPWTEVAQDYERMRKKLGNWNSRQFDRFMSNYGTYGYDISAAANQYGSWIGWGNEPAWKSTAADKCTAQFPNMTQQERVDYIMLLPPTAMNPATPETNNEPTEKYPEWSISKQATHPNVEIDKHFIDDANGCVSDHAEVIAHLELVHLTSQMGYNPYKYHRVKYSVSDIWDIHEDDPGDEAEFFGNMSIDVTGQAAVQDSWNEDTTPRDGFHSNPGWYVRSGVFGGNVVVNTRLQIWENDDPGDDHYDAYGWYRLSKTGPLKSAWINNPPPGGCLDTHLGFDHTSGTLWLTDCAALYLNSVPPGGYGHYVGSLLTNYAKAYVNSYSFSIWTEGNGNNGKKDAGVWHHFTVCDADHPEQCSP